MAGVTFRRRHASARDRRPARDHPPELRRQPAPPADRRDRPLLPAPLGQEGARSRTAWARWRDLVRAGKVRSIGLSEVSAATLRKAHAVHPIAARADRVFAVDAQPRDRGAAGLPRAGHQLRRLQPGGARLSCAARCSTWPRSTPRTSAAACRASRPTNYAANLKLLPAYKAMAQRGRLHAGAAGAGLAAAPGRPTSCPFPAPPAWSTCRDDLGAADVKLAADLMAAAGRAHQPAHRAGQPLQRAEQQRGGHRSVWLKQTEKKRVPRRHPRARPPGTMTVMFNNVPKGARHETLDQTHPDRH